MLKKSKIGLLLFISLGLITLTLIGCTPEIDIDWEEVNDALSKKGYNTKSLAEAEVIFGYRIPKLKKVPPSFKKDPNILIKKINPFQEDPSLLYTQVTQRWVHEDGDEFGAFSLTLEDTPIPSYWDYDFLKINGINVVDWMRGDGKVGGLAWYNEGVYYVFGGMITETLTVDLYIKMAKSLIN